MTFRSRVIPVLLLRQGQLYKSIRFRKHNYIGDAINAVRLFSMFLADELVILDTDASKNGYVIDSSIVRNIAQEARMPFAVGGGISSLKQIEVLLRNGADKVVLNSALVDNQEFLRDAVHHFGASTIVVCVDLKRGILGGYHVYRHINKRCLSIDYLTYLRQIDDYAPGEIIIQSVDLDGTMKGYDKSLYLNLASLLKSPVLALGGAGSVTDITDLMNETCINAFCASSMFLYQGKLRGVLINYTKVSRNVISNSRE